MGDIKQNTQNFLLQVDKACRHAHREGSGITVVAASKYAKHEEIRQAAEGGIQIFAENRYQDAESKMKVLKDRSLTWHYIGRIQSNKVRRIFADFEMIQSVDRLEVLHKANACLKEMNLKREVLLQVNISEEDSKAGFAYKNVESFFKNDENKIYPQLTIRGLMGIGPLTESKDQIRKCFKRFREFFGSQQKIFLDLKILSMGMTHDFEEAIQEGSTMIRLGSAIFKGDEKPREG